MVAGRWAPQRGRRAPHGDDAWYDHEPMTEAADWHEEGDGGPCSIGPVVTTDGTVTDIPGEITSRRKPGPLPT